MAKILIVDDSRTSRKFLKTMLEADQHEIIGEASNGLEGIQKYKELHPDITTMDITMPELDGIGAVKQIKAEDPNAKIIMCSAMGQQAMVLESIQAGARDFIVKPFQADRIVEAINKCLKWQMDIVSEMLPKGVTFFCLNTNKFRL